jgi:hypothetical protein
MISLEIVVVRTVGGMRFKLRVVILEIGLILEQIKGSVGSLRFLQRRTECAQVPRRRKISYSGVGKKLDFALHVSLYL